MKRFLLLVVLLAGCDGKSPATKQIAKPVDDVVAEKPIAVACEKPAATTPEAQAAIDKLLITHTKDNVAALSAFRNCIVRRSGEMDQGGNMMPAECVDRFAWPDRYRADWAVMSSMILFVTGETVSLQTATNPMPEVQGPAMTVNVLEDLRGTWMTLLVPLIDKSRVTAAVAKDVPNGLRVWIANQTPLLLIVDPKTGLLAKVMFEKVSDGRSETWSFLVSEYKTTRGVLLPGKVVYTPGSRAGATWTSVEYEPIEAFPSGTFEKR